MFEKIIICSGLIISIMTVRKLAIERVIETRGELRGFKNIVEAFKNKKH